MGPGITGLVWVGISVFLLAMSKGGFPIGNVAVPLLILVWPAEHNAARGAVAFMLPVLCVMDAIAMAFYWRTVQWSRLYRLFPGALLGIALGSALFVSDDVSLLSLSDRGLTLCIGLLGLLFCLYQVFRLRILRRLESAHRPGWPLASLFGAAAGVTSTLAHAAGPVMQMYLLPQQLPKMQFAATTAAFFWIVNLAKMVPFLALGRIDRPNLLLAAAMLPVVPLGVACGYGAVRLMRSAHYVVFIYGMLAAASLTLVLRALRIF